MASTVHRQDTISGLKRFNARRKLKAAMHTAMIVSRRSTALGCEYNLKWDFRMVGIELSSFLSSVGGTRNATSPRSSDTSHALPVITDEDNRGGRGHVQYGQHNM